MSVYRVTLRQKGREPRVFVTEDRDAAYVHFNGLETLVRRGNGYAGVVTLAEAEAEGRQWWLLRHAETGGAS